METKWVDISEVPFIKGWHCMRSAQVTSEGVGTLITMTLLDHQEQEHQWMFVMPIEIAQRIGWDLMGEGGGYFSEMVVGYENEPDRLDSDDV